MSVFPATVIGPPVMLGRGPICCCVMDGRDPTTHDFAVPWADGINQPAAPRA